MRQIFTKAVPPQRALFTVCGLTAGRTQLLFRPLNRWCVSRPNLLVFPWSSRGCSLFLCYFGAFLCRFFAAWKIQRAQNITEENREKNALKTVSSSVKKSSFYFCVSEDQWLIQADISVDVSSLQISRVGSCGATTVTMNFAIENKIWQRVETNQWPWKNPDNITWRKQSVASVASRKTQNIKI